MSRATRLTVVWCVLVAWAGAGCLLEVDPSLEPAPDKLPGEPDVSKSSCPSGYTLDGTVDVECDNFQVSEADFDINTPDYRDGKCFISCTCSYSAEKPPDEDICTPPRILADSVFNNHACAGTILSTEEVEVPGLNQQFCEGQDFALALKEQACDNHCAGVEPMTDTFTCCRPIGMDAGTPDAGGPDAGGSDAGGSDAGYSDAGSSDAGYSDAGYPDASYADAGGYADASYPADASYSQDAW